MHFADAAGQDTVLECTQRSAQRASSHVLGEGTSLSGGMFCQICRQTSWTFF